jgi:hypothetical protein
MLQSQHKDCAVLYNICLLLLHSGLIDPPITLLVMHECCMGNADEYIGRKSVDSSMRFVAFLLAAKVKIVLFEAVFFIVDLMHAHFAESVGFVLLPNSGSSELFGKRSRGA